MARLDDSDDDSDGPDMGGDGVDPFDMMAPADAWQPKQSWEVADTTEGTKEAVADKAPEAKAVADSSNAEAELSEKVEAAAEVSEKPELSKTRMHACMSTTPSLDMLNLAAPEAELAAATEALTFTKTNLMSFMKQLHELGQNDNEGYMEEYGNIVEGDGSPATASQQHRTLDRYSNIPACRSCLVAGLGLLLEADACCFRRSLARQGDSG